MLNKPKSRKIAAALAFAGVVTPVPITGIHKFYLGQPWWGVLYLVLSWTPISRIASAVEGAWYLFQDDSHFDRNFNHSLSPLPSTAAVSRSVPSEQIGAIADALRQLDQLRQDGLISEYEFEQKRRKLLDRIE